MFRKIGVFGFGLLGGALCSAVKNLGAPVSITVFDSDTERADQAVRLGLADRARAAGPGCAAGLDLVVITAPVVAALDILRLVLDDPELPETALVIDAGSVKQPIVDAALSGARPGAFIGCHPMTGSEKSGYRPELGNIYEGASVIITPHHLNAPADIERAALFWRSLGARTFVTTAEHHDRIISLTSHIPHLAAALLVEGIERAGSEEGLDFAHHIGRGFLDMTRIASGSPEMWRDICVLNRQRILDGIGAFRDSLDRVADLIRGWDAEGLEKYFNRVKNFRDGL